MLPKKNRAVTKEVDKIFKQGRIVHSPSLTLRYLKTDKNESKISFIAPKNIAKSAVKRNLLRRRGYNSLKKNINLLPFPIIGAFILKKYEDDLLILENEIKSLLNKIN